MTYEASSFKFSFTCTSLCLMLLCYHDVVRALTESEIDEFGARTHIDPNTGVQGYITITDYDADYYLVTSNGVPDHTAGAFAVIPDEYDNVLVQNFRFFIPKSPTASDVKYVLPMGPIGLATNGVAMFNPYSAEGTDAMITEAPTFDVCDGHPTPDGVYHYHGSLKCVFDLEEGTPSGIVGVALDGFPVYGPNDENGNRLYSEDLDQCHGRYVDGAYRYHITEDFPYILGCFHGAVDERNTRRGESLATVQPQPETTTGSRANSFHPAGGAFVINVVIILLSIVYSY